MSNRRWNIIGDGAELWSWGAPLHDHQLLGEQMLLLGVLGLRSVRVVGGVQVQAKKNCKTFDKHAEILIFYVDCLFCSVTTDSYKL